MYCNLAYILLILAYTQSKLIIHSPDEISDLNFETYPLKIGIPALYPLYGTLTFIYSNSCDTKIYGAKDKIVVLLNPIFCNITDFAIKSYAAGTRMMMIVDDYQGTLAKAIGEKQYSKDFPDMVMITVSNDFCDKICQFSPVLVSYVYDTSKSKEPKIRGVLSGIHEIDKPLIDIFSDLLNKYHISPENIELNFVYKPGSEASQDCLYLFDNYYCSWNSSTYTGQEVLTNLIYTQSYFNSFPHMNNALPKFLEYLRVYYNECYSDYSSLCHSRIMHSFDSDSYLSDNKVLESALVFENFQAFIGINNVDFSWPEYIKPAYCISSENPSDDCPLCSIGCTYKILEEDKDCYDPCNNSDCGYQNLQCLLVSKDCYSFMLEDSFCNRACEEDTCTNETSYGDSDDKRGKGLEYYLPLIIIPSIIFIIVVIVFIIVLIKKNKSKSIRIRKLIIPQQILHPIKFNKNMEMLKDVTCPIDLDKFRENDEIIVTSCKHFFHLTCFKEWIERVDIIEKTCPICKSPLKGYGSNNDESCIAIN
ncbi:hypothetical protein SteCoe_37067 [Stentor coeruleus]|uniref:RING-type domain-containing protein n=1 Tax=Stentor coeruleus TaxID=5963 RepID=A0A1R2ANR7_9CILI|nr:hypothetical protein SteCoe_37067 [Stentor coeruleus]